MTRLDDDTQQQFRHELSSFTMTLVYSVTVVILLSALFCMLAIFRISSFAFQTYDSYQNIPHNKVGVLLGTSSNVAPGQDNHYFTYRIMAATELYNAGRIDYILVSGDNQHDSYNEPRMMYRALVKNGIPPEKITMDFAGINTLNSVVRAARVFMLPNMTIISQSFQNERALFIADHFGIKAIAYNATDPDSGWNSLKISLREVAARIKCILDVYFLDTQPKFLGAPIKIGDIIMPKQPSNKARHPTSKIKQPGRSVAGLKELGITVPKPDLPHKQLLPYQPIYAEDVSFADIKTNTGPDSPASENNITAGSELSSQAVPHVPEQQNIEITPPLTESDSQQAASSPQARAMPHQPAALTQSPKPQETPPAQTPQSTLKTAFPPQGDSPTADNARSSATAEPQRVPPNESVLLPELEPVLDEPEQEGKSQAQSQLTEEQIDNLQLQDAILRAEQAKALADAVEAASESLNTGNSSTYIDPNIKENNEMLEQPAETPSD